MQKKNRSINPVKMVPLVESATQFFQNFDHKGTKHLTSVLNLQYFLRFHDNETP